MGAETFALRSVVTIRCFSENVKQVQSGCSGFLGDIAIADETWPFQYDPDDKA